MSWDGKNNLLLDPLSNLRPWTLTWDHPASCAGVTFFFFLERFPQNLTCTLNGCAGNLPDLSRRGDGGVEPSQTVSSAAAFYSQPGFLSWEKIYCGPPRHGIWSRSWDLEGILWRDCAELGVLCLWIPSPDSDMLCGPGHVIHRLTAFLRLLII